jgi:putative membrane protein
MKLILHLLTTVFALLLIAQYGLIPGFSVDGFYTALVVAILLGLASITIKPLLLLLTLPINILTLGLFVFVINALLLWLIATFVQGFTITGFVPALIAALVISAVHWIIERLT